MGENSSETGLSVIPVRPCCGQRHLGALCPDGHFMCCLCFDRFPLAEASIIASKDEWNGMKQDVCRSCAWDDGPSLVVRWMAVTSGGDARG